MAQEKKNRKRMLIAASIAGLMTVTGAAMMSSSAAYAADVECYGVNACKGQGECGGKDHGCAGKNACKGQGWISTATSEACLGMEGGSLTPPATV